MKTFLFDENILLEVNVIGYKNEGESIVFFIIVDEITVFAGVIDCYKYSSINKSIELLENHGKGVFDFVCWTHPHKDHSVGIDKIMDSFCNTDTSFWIPPFPTADVEKYKVSYRDIYSSIFDRITEAKNKKRLCIREVSDAKKLVRRRFQSVKNRNQKLDFEIISFAPDSELIAANRIKGIDLMDNLYSIGIIIIFGDYYVMLAGDLENQTINAIPDENLDYPITYLKIPHHGSSSAADLMCRLSAISEAVPQIASTTVYRRHNLPDSNVINGYFNWNKNIELYSSGHLKQEEEKDEFGIVKTTFDILEKKEFNIETELIGNAVRYIAT